ncbi:MAG: hypothetical protein M3367_02965 [Acidobacteriota bacterium]|nr:hypothetical protein [Acidobacteriota bacterium]
MSPELEFEKADVQQTESPPAISELTEIVETATEQTAVSNLYDARANQKIPLTIAKGDKQFDVAIELAPVTDDEWFQLMADVPAGAKRIKTISVELFAPYAKLGREKLVNRFGYKDNPNWKLATRDKDCISALKSYLNVVANKDAIETDDLLDDDVDTPVALSSEIVSIDWETTIYFREETKAEMDEFLAAFNNAPDKTAIATHKKTSAERRFYALGEALMTRSEGYKNDIVPAWHLVEAVKVYLDSQLVRLGKL